MPTICTEGRLLLLLFTDFLASNFFTCFPRTRAWPHHLLCSASLAQLGHCELQRCGEGGKAVHWVAQTTARALNRAGIASNSKHEHCIHNTIHSTKTSSVPLCCPGLLPALRSRCPEPCDPAVKGPIVVTNQQGKAKVPRASKPGLYVLRSVCFALC